MFIAPERYRKVINANSGICLTENNVVSTMMGLPMLWKHKEHREYFSVLLKNMLRLLVMMIVVVLVMWLVSINELRETRGRKLNVGWY